MYVHAELGLPGYAAIRARVCVCARHDAQPSHDSTPSSTHVCLSATHASAHVGNITSECHMRHQTSQATGTTATERDHVGLTTRHIHMCGFTITGLWSRFPVCGVCQWCLVTVGLWCLSVVSGTQTCVCLRMMVLLGLDWAGPHAISHTCVAHAVLCRESVVHAHTHLCCRSKESVVTVAVAWHAEGKNPWTCMVPCSDTGASFVDGVLLCVACVVLRTRLWPKRKSRDQ